MICNTSRLAWARHGVDHEPPRRPQRCPKHRPLRPKGSPPVPSRRSLFFSKGKGIGWVQSVFSHVANRRTFILRLEPIRCSADRRGSLRMPHAAALFQYCPRTRAVILRHLRGIIGNDRHFYRPSPKSRHRTVVALCDPRHSGAIPYGRHHI